MRISYDFVKYTVWAALSAVAVVIMTVSAGMPGVSVLGSLESTPAECLFILGTTPWVFGFGYSAGHLLWMAGAPKRAPTHAETIRIVRKRDGKK